MLENIQRHGNQGRTTQEENAKKLHDVIIVLGRILSHNALLLYVTQMQFFLFLPLPLSSTRKALPMPHPSHIRHPLHDIPLSRRRLVSLICQPVAPMAAAVRLRSKLSDLGYTVLILSPSRMMINSPERPKRFEEYHIDQAERLLEVCYE
jgi:hypothetical protein